MHVNNLGQVNKTRIEDAAFVVIDFETVTPKGRPPEPIEVAAMRITPGLQIDPTLKVDWLIRPPEGAPITPFDTTQTGIRWEDVREEPLAAVVLEKLENLLRDKEYIMVAQNARYEASLILRFSDICRRTARMAFVDTIALAKHLVPGLPNYKLNTLANHFSVTIPKHRHRALPDVEMTAQIFLRLLKIGRTTKTITNIIDLKRVAGIKTRYTGESTQTSLFE